MVLTWIISTVECNESNSPNNGIQTEATINAEFFQDNVSPITHMELGEEKRTRRYSDFDRGYDEFLRNYHNDGGDNIERTGRYQVKESDESESDESTSGSDEEEDESESYESEENRKKYKKPQKPKGKNKKSEQNAPKKQSKHCKTEKRGNMLCNICYNPKNDEKTESCSYNSDPDSKNYEYSEDKSYSSKDKKPTESLEDDEESHENEGKKKHPPVNRYPVKNSNHHQNAPPPNAPRYYPKQQGHRPNINQYPSQHQHRNQHLSPNYGPQIFIPQSYQPISLRPTGSRPIRIQIKNSPTPLAPPVALIRYRTVEAPFGSQHVRLITYPSGPPPSYGPPPQNQQNRPLQYYNNNNRRPAKFEGTQEIRPPRDLTRDINGAHSESLLSNVTKELFLPIFARGMTRNIPRNSPIFGINPIFGNNNNNNPNINNNNNGPSRDFAGFMGKDGSRCRRTMEDNHVCFECFVDGERRKECMLRNTRPDNSFKSFSTVNKFKTNHPYEFEEVEPPVSVSKHTKQHTTKTKMHSTHGNNNKNKPVQSSYSDENFGGNSDSDERFNGDLKLSKYEILPKNTNGWELPKNTNDWDLHPSLFHNVNKEVKPQAQPLRSSSASDIVYGKARPGAEPLALFFQTDPMVFSSIKNNNTNIDLYTTTNKPSTSSPNKDSTSKDSIMKISIGKYKPTTNKPSKKSISTKTTKSP